MNRVVFTSAFLLGAIVVIWMASGFVGSDALALAVTLLIGCVYTVGFIELLQFRWATSTLSNALCELPKQADKEIATLNRWLDKLDPSLQNSVRLRIEGERVGLPAPVITPYLVGLLVMLGLLGTFAGMVETLKGAVYALEGTTELQAIRAGLTAPIKGLSLAFGTSVAGVASSAMLGLISTLCRRDRMLATRRLDTTIATVFRGFSLIYNRQETYKALQQQAQALPEVVEKLHAMAGNLERTGDKLADKLVANQDLFHQSVTTMYSELASSVDQSLRESMVESGRLAGESINPLVKEAMAAICKEARNTHQQLSATAQQQLEALSGRFTDTTEQVTGAWRASLDAHERSNEALIAGMSTSFEAFSGQFERTGTSMLESFDDTATRWFDRQQSGDKERLEHWTGALAQTQQQAAAQLVDASKTLTGELRQVTGMQQASFKVATQDFESLSSALTAKWLQASEGVCDLTSTVKTELSALRHEISNSIERDNSLLEERLRIMEELNTLSSSLQQASAGQREAIEGLVNSSATMLQDIGSRFTGQVEAELSQLSESAAHFAGSATEISSLGEAFGLAVNLFNESNGSLIESLDRIEESMAKSTSRSDEQMGYYVAQAREIIDHSIVSQREMIEELRRLSQSKDLVAAELGTPSESTS